MRSAVRTVWDGDQVLYEMSAPGANATGVIENDTGLLNTYFGYGRVAYSHGLGIDDPLSLVRMEYSDSIPEPVRIVPTSNWAGRYDGGIGGRCIVYGSEQIREVVWAPGEREDDTGTIPAPPPGGGPPEHCVRVAWPAQALWMNLARRNFGNGSPSWTGSLVRHGRDPSGQSKKRAIPVRGGHELGHVWGMIFKGATNLNNTDHVREQNTWSLWFENNWRKLYHCKPRLIHGNDSDAQNPPCMGEQ